jgi:uncharacterized membrane protein
MPELIVLTFPDQAGAAAAAERIQDLEEDRLIKVADAATLVRSVDGAFALHQAPGRRRSNFLMAAASAMTWGIGALFLATVLTFRFVSLVLNAFVARSFASAQIDERFVRKIGASIQPGQAALFLLLEEGDHKAAAAEFAGSGATVHWTTLSRTEHSDLQAGMNGRDVADEVLDEVLDETTDADNTNFSANGSPWDFSV